MLDILRFYVMGTFQTNCTSDWVTEVHSHRITKASFYRLCAFLSSNQHLKALERLNAPVTHTHTHPFNGPLSGTTQVSRYQKGKTNLDFTEARDSEWQWHQLGHMQICTSLQTDNHASTTPLSFLQAGCPSCRPANSVKALKVNNAPVNAF